MVRGMDAIVPEDLEMWSRLAMREPFISAGAYARELEQKGESLEIFWGEGSRSVVVNGKVFGK
jgi:hypothetical protein